VNINLDLHFEFRRYGRTPSCGRVDEKWSELNKYHDILTVRATSVHALFAPLDHKK
jgi:hypothetical protein